MQQYQRGPDRRSEWKFLITDQGWLWSVTRAGVEQQSAAAYATLQDAGVDAARHGYGTWKSDERRRGDRREFND